MLAPLLLASTLVSQFVPSWLSLGERAITSDVDRDTIAVAGSHGTFRAIKMSVRGSAVRFNRVVLRFENGAQRELQLDVRVPAGGETRAIHLKGEERELRSIEFWYEAASVGRRGAVVQLLGQSRT
ncbi:MAG TPA: hypothetical protein VFP91_15420 [Vicinamibacterales bacterium]|nr:hypothetical protein [Vicinamibacterales bacterium]